MEERTSHIRVNKWQQNVWTIPLNSQIYGWIILKCWKMWEHYISGLKIFSRQPGVTRRVSSQKVICLSVLKTKLCRTQPAYGTYLMSNNKFPSCLSYPCILFSSHIIYKYIFHMRFIFWIKAYNKHNNVSSSRKINPDRVIVTQTQGYITRS